jgi:PAS domain S-box-containing protein
VTELPHLFELDALRAVGAVGFFLFVTRDDAGVVLYATPEAEKLFGYESGGLAGRPVEDLVPERFRADHRRHRLAYNAEPAGRPKGDGMPVTGLTRDGREVPLVVGLACHRTPAPTLLDLVCVTVLRKAEPGRHSRPAADPAAARGVSPFNPVVAVAAAALVLAGGIANFASLPAPTPRPEAPAVGSATAPAKELTDGLAAMRGREYERAAGHLHAAAEAGADPTLALGALAECYFYLGRFEKALAACDRLNAEVPNAGRAHYVRGLVRHRQGRRGEAADEFRQAARFGDAVAAACLGDLAS